MNEVKSINLDITFPLSDYEQLRNQKRFYFIGPLVHTKAFDIEKASIRALAFDDEVANMIRSGQKLNFQPQPYFIDFYNIRYTRDCRLSDIVRAEWESNYGATTMSQYLTYEPMESLESGETKPVDQDTFMRVVCLERLDHQLRTLNNRYGRGKLTKSSIG